jgi:hypothetical protein
MEKWTDCDQCGAPIPVGATRCLKCGKRFVRGVRQPLSKSLLSRIIAALLLVLAVKLLFNLLAAAIGLLLVTVLWAAYRGYQNRIS